MKDHDITPIRRDEIPDQPFTDDPHSVTARTPRRSPRELPDRTTRLVADVLGTSAPRAIAVMQALGGLEGLAFASEADIMAASLPRQRARLVRAAFELARQSIGARPMLGNRLGSAADVWLHMRARLSGSSVEEFWALAMDVRHRVVLDSMLARGSLTGVEVHPRDVFRALIKVGAAAVIFVHNHPSGDPSPSRDDLALTKRLREVGDLVGIAVLDHVVVARQGYISLAERGWT